MGWDARVQYGKRVTLNDLVNARRFTARLWEEEPGLLAPAANRRLNEGERCLVGAMTADERIAEQRRFAEEWKRKNPSRYDTRRRFSVSIPR
jgi:hypothetical protein